MTDINELFFELVRVAIGTQKCLSRVPSAEEWQLLFDMANKQSLVGVCFAGVQRLGANADTVRARIGMTEMLFFRWMSMAYNIQKRNEVLNECMDIALYHFRQDGFECTCLKGQGIAALYEDEVRTKTNSLRHVNKDENEGLRDENEDENEGLRDEDENEDESGGRASMLNLAMLRQSGDIDLWVQGGRKRLYEYSMRLFGKIEGLTYHHIHFAAFSDVEVEAHTWPSYLASPLRNRRLQRFFKMYEPAKGSGDTPSLEFNIVYILLHCYQHFCGHGVGMRQLMDYYFVLKKVGICTKTKTKTKTGVAHYDEDANENEQCSREEAMAWIERLGMSRFAQAMMWVMKEVFGLKDEDLLCEPNEAYGRFLLDEVLMTGNMGHGDERVDHRQFRTAFGRYRYNLRRAMRIVKICPHEALWGPFWGIYQFTWCRVTRWWYQRPAKGCAT